MYTNQQTCSIKGHEMYKITHICTYKQCLQATRFMCEECNRKLIHIHEANEKFIRLGDFHIYLETRVKSNIEQQKKEALRIPQFIQQIKWIQQQLCDITNSQKNYLLNLKEIVNSYKLTNKKLLALNTQQLNYLINIEYYNLDYFKIQNELQKIVQQLQGVIKESFAFSYYTHNVIKLKDLESPSISQNEQYFGFLVDNKFLKINKLKSNQTIMNKCLDGYICFAKFSLNSKFIFSSDFCGRIRQLSTKNNCKQIFSRQAQIEIGIDHIINDFIEINNYEVVICSQNIIIYDYIRRRQLLRINTGTYVCCLDYDRINNLIVASLFNKITFYDRYNGNLMISKSFSIQKEFHKIQLTNKSQNLLGSDKYSLKVWSIDLQDKQLILIKVFNHEVLYFKSVYEDQRIIIRNKNQLIILDSNLNTMYENTIEKEDYWKIAHFDELETMNYILIFYPRGALVIWKKINKV